MIKNSTHHLVVLVTKHFCQAILILALMFGAGSVPLLAQTVSQTFTTSGTFTAPPCVTSVQVQSWGGGGGGGGSITNPANNSGGGGGGGAYVLVANVTVIPGNNYAVSVGTGGTAGVAVSGGNGGSSSFNGLATAAGGAGGALYNNFFSAGNGAGGAGGTGGTYNGGNGNSGSHPDSGGGGGGGAGTTGNGGNGGLIVAGTGGTAGPGSPPGGVGGDGGSTDGLPGVAPGGGGGGSNTQNLLGGTSHTGGVGAAGQVIVTYTLTSPTITSVTGGGCVGNTITVNGTNLSSASSVTIGATAVTNLVVNPTVITGTIAAGTTTGLVTVTTPCGTATSASSFVVNQAGAPVVLPAQSICAGGSFSFGGQNYTTAGTYSYTTPSTITGCDSTTTVTLSITSVTTQAISQSICSGGSYTFGGQTYTTAGTYSNTTTSTITGCDSITTLTLSVSPPLAQTVNQSICAGGSYAFNGNNYTTAGTYPVTLAGAGTNGCDSIVTLILAVSSAVTSTTNDSICQGASFTFNGNVYTSAGTYPVTLTGAGTNGCDSIATLVLSIKSGSVSSVTVTASPLVFCAGDSSHVCATAGFVSYLWNSADTGSCFYTSLAGNYYVTATDAFGCTATSNHLAINAFPATSISISVNGDTLTCYSAGTYQWYLDNLPIPGGTHATLIALLPGSYIVNVTDSNGCHVSSNAINISTTGVSNIKAGEIKVYPNPLATGNWQVEVNESLLGSKYDVFDAEGRSVYKGELREIQSNIAMDVMRGVYILQIHGKETNYNIRLIKL